MADGPYRFQQPGAGQYYYPQHNQQNHHARHLPRNQSPGNGGRAGYSNDTPSPSRSPVSQSAAHIPFGMYNQGHQQGQHMMMNGGPSHQRYNMQMSLAQKYQHQTHQQHHGQPHHQQQQTQGGHGGHGSNISHQHTFSSGTLSSATPHFTPNHLQNGASSNALGNLNEPISEHWQQQLQLVQESRQASSPHYYARTLAQTNKAVSQTMSNAQTDGEKEERSRPSTSNESRRQQWMALDFGGQGIRSISDALFNYQFLDKLYFNHNKLVHIPAAIGRLRNLTHLDLSNNQLSELPPEIGMLVNLKSLYLFDNNLHSLPCEMGFLCHLETLGIEGNPLEEESKMEVMQNGTKALITRLRENLPSKYRITFFDLRIIQGWGYRAKWIQYTRRRLSGIGSFWTILQRLRQVHRPKSSLFSRTTFSATKRRHKLNLVTRRHKRCRGTIEKTSSCRKSENSMQILYVYKKSTWTVSMNISGHS